MFKRALFISILTILLSILVAVFSTKANAYRATDCCYGEDNYYPIDSAAHLACAAIGEEVVYVDSNPTTGIDPDTWRWFDEFTVYCTNGKTTTYRVPGNPAPPMPIQEESNYQPDSGSSDSGNSNWVSGVTCDIYTEYDWIGC